MRTLYVDELLVCNLYMNWIVLRLTARLTHTGCPAPRLLLGAAVGSLTSLMILLPRMPPAVSVPLRIALAFPICMAAFGGRGRLLRLTGTFIAVSALMAGLLLALGSAGLMHTLHRNGVWYMGLSLTRLVVLTIVLYAVITLVQRLRERRPDRPCRVCIRLKGNAVTLDGIADTGNTLTDFFSGDPVILCPERILTSLGDPGLLRPLPCRTVAGSTMVEVFRPDEVCLLLPSGESKCVRVLIGITRTPVEGGIYHPRLLDQ